MNQPRKTVAAGVTTLIICLLLISIVPANVVSAATQVDITVDPTNVIGTNKLSLGTMLDWEWKSWRDSSTQRQLLEDANIKLIRIFSNRIEPCTRWSDTSKTGTFNWANVDSLVQRMFDAGAEPLICLGKFSSAGGKLSTPSGMGTNPATGLPYAESYAAYCAEWVKHFKAMGLPVRYYEIVNEPYFYYGWDRKETKLIGNFVTFFNTVARSMRSVNSGVLLGSDASLQKKFLDYFVVYADNLDYLDFHKYALGEGGGSDAQALSLAETQYFAQETSSYYTVDQARQIWQNKRGKLLPVILSEGNLSYAWTDGSDPRIQQLIGAAYTALVLKAAILNGLSYCVYYVFASSASTGQRSGTGYGFGMVNSDNGQPWYPYYVYDMIGTRLSVGDQIVKITTSSSDISSIAWIHDAKLIIMLVSKVNTQQAVYLHGSSNSFNYLKIDASYSWTSPRLQTGTINPSQSININGYTVELLEAQTSNSPSPPPPPQPPQESSILLQDGFESGNFANWDGVWTSLGETAIVDSAIPYSGSYEARFTTNAGNSLESSYCYKKIDEESVYFSGYFCFAYGLPMSDDGDLFYIIRLRAGDQSIAGLGVKKYGGNTVWTAYGRNGQGWIWSSSLNSPTVQPTHWYHIELYWEKNTAQGKISVSIDGQNLLETLNSNTAYFGNTDCLHCGIISASKVQRPLIVLVDSIKITITP